MFVLAGGACRGGLGVGSEHYLFSSLKPIDVCVCVWVGGVASDRETTHVI
jgi:hypothetical protein